MNLMKPSQKMLKRKRKRRKKVAMSNCFDYLNDQFHCDTVVKCHAWIMVTNDVWIFIANLQIVCIERETSCDLSSRKI